MRIGVVSDTHSKPLPGQMLEDFRTVDLIIHAGDFCEVADYEVLSKIKEVRGVQGNMDCPAIRKIFPRRQVFSCGGVHIGLYHGEGPPKTLMEKVQGEFKNDNVDVVIFGHSHQSLNEKNGDVLYFNPGSPNDKVFAPYCSYGILDISEKGIIGKIIKVKDG